MPPPKDRRNVSRPDPGPPAAPPEPQGPAWDAPAARNGAGGGPGSESGGGRLADFLFEAATLKRTPRTGYQFLGRGHENVAEHSFGTALTAWVLGRLSGRVDTGRLVAMALFHDLAEARTGDLNYVNKRYVASDEDRAFADAVRGLPFADELSDLWADWRLGESLEARLARDADQLDMIVELQRLSGHGWRQADDWLFYAGRRLGTDEGRRLARLIADRGPDDWWFERRDDLWVEPRFPAPEPGEAGTGPGPRAAMAAAAKAGTAKTGAAKTGTVKTGAVKTADDGTAKPVVAKPAQGKASQAKASQAKKAPTKTTKANPAKVKAAQAKASQAKKAPTKTTRAKPAKVKAAKVKTAGPGPVKAAGTKPGGVKPAEPPPVKGLAAGSAPARPGPNKTRPGGGSRR